MKRALMLLVVAIFAAIPAQAELVEIEVTGFVEWNYSRHYPLNQANPGDPVTYSFMVNSDNYLDSATFPTRGYEIIGSTLTVQAGPAVLNVANPYPSWYAPPYFVLANDDPAVDGFFMTSGQVDWDWPGVMTDLYGWCGNFEAHFSVGYDQFTIDSLNIVEAAGTYQYDGLTRFYFNLVDCGFEVVGIDFNQLTISRVPVPVAVDVKPTSCPNPLNLTSNGLVPVAILGTADLDVTTIDPASIRLHGLAPVRSAREMTSSG
jgi:hypothetical protein